MCEPALGSVPEQTPSKQPLIATIFRRYGSRFLARYRVTREQRLAIHNISYCRTLAMGANRRDCPHCGHHELHYNSCRDRHCPRCQWLVRASWTARRQARSLPVPNFFVTFTVPAEFRPIAQFNRDPVFKLLFQAASSTLLELGKETLGTLGITAVLHTWSRSLIFHPHLHAVVTAGGLADDRWISTRPGFLFPVARVRALFRKHVLQGLHQLYDTGSLAFPGKLSSLSSPAAFGALVRQLWKSQWVVDIQPPRGKPHNAVKYLAAYTRSVAISEHRMVSLSPDGIVTFKTRGAKRMSLPAEDFLGRFLLHVLPSGLHKTRHYGLYANGAHARLERARQLISDSDRPVPAAPDSTQPTTTEPPAPDPLVTPTAATSWQDHILLLTGVDPRVCPRCGRDGMLFADLTPRFRIRRRPRTRGDSS